MADARTDVPAPTEPVRPAERHELRLGGSIDPTTHGRVSTDGATDLTIATDAFTTHGVIVGMTGSGKTGLGVVLIEEVLRSGTPVIAIDPKGDLTNLHLLFPGLSGAEFRPWVDEAQADNAGQTPDEFAASQASMWSDGLAGWGLGGADIGALRDAVDITVYTPGSTSGVPLDLVGSLQVPADMSDAETIADEIDGYVSGLLGLVGIVADPLASREHILLSNLVNHAWTQGQPLDLTVLVGQVAAPPIRKLGVFDIDQFFPEQDRMALAMRLNGLLASASFAAWAAGEPLDIDAMLTDPDGRPRCAVITTAHLSDEERQFVTSLLLSKLVTWMRRQSGTTDLRAMLYMDEVAGYLPPTENPPTKKPIMTLMKQARAFGVGVVLATQNPVDVDYKAISNAGTWMIGRLQTDRDKARLLDGMTSAAGGVDVEAIGATISGLGKREFVLRRAGKDTAEVFTSRWAMSYLRGPMTRDQIASITKAPRPAATSSAGPAHTAIGDSAPGTPPAATDDSTSVMPGVASGIAVRYVDVAAPWLGEVGGDPTATIHQPAVLARVALRYDDTKAGLVHDTEYEAVLFPLADPLDITTARAVDYDERDLRPNPPANTSANTTPPTATPPTATPPTSTRYGLTAAPIDAKAWWSQVERDLRDHLVRVLTVDLPVNTGLKLYGRPGESTEQFAVRCTAAASEAADRDTAALRSKYEGRAIKLRDQLAAANDRVDVLEEEAEGKRNSELLSTAGSVLGGLLGGRKSGGGLLGGLLGTAGGAARRRGSSSASAARVDAAENKAQRITAQIEQLEDELDAEVSEITQRASAAAADVTTMSIGLEKTDVKVTHMCLAWLPSRS
jgi:Helicase HerA, central domain